MTPDTPPFSASANQAAIGRLAAVRPVWRAVLPARDALGLPDFVLLHAGPPFEDPTRPAAPVLSSAVLCCLHEGWAASETEAESLIASGRVGLLPAQGFDAVAPLAAVISPSSMLVEVADAHAPQRRAWSLLGSGAGPQLRFGSRDPAILPRLAWRDGPLAEAMARMLDQAPMHLLPLALSGLAGGDDLHGRTTAATQALLAHWRPALDDAAPDAAAMLENTPLFFLTLWMAACHLMLSAAAENADGSTLVVALAGNGERCGIRLAGRPEQWHTVPAGPPAGPRLDAGSTAQVSPMLGDSGAIDVAGFGGQALGCSPEVAGALGPWLPPDARQRTALLYTGIHPAFTQLGLRTALDAEAVCQNQTAPLAAIAMVDAAGRQGLLGRGLFIPPVTLFEQAVAALNPA